MYLINTLTTHVNINVLYNCIYTYVYIISEPHPDVSTLTDVPETAVMCAFGSANCNERYFVKIRKCDKTVEYHLPPTQRTFSAYCLGSLTILLLLLLLLLCTNFHYTCIVFWIVNKWNSIWSKDIDNMWTMLKER